MEIKTSSWIMARDTGDVCLAFRRRFAADKTIDKAELQITALAVPRAGDKAGEAKLTVSAEGLGQAEICLQVKENAAGGVPLLKENAGSGNLPDPALDFRG